ncbi:hypothetical protein HK102_009911 [Quaeritorhiza haematococci]|nr:hypothetical protein HK102_009911 [Quaeritorhiza haematococci]
MRLASPRVLNAKSSLKIKWQLNSQRSILPKAASSSPSGSAYLKQTLVAEKPVEISGPDTSTPVARSASVSSGSTEYTSAEEALIALDLQDRVKEVAKHVKKLSAERAIDRKSWIEVGMAIHHATDGQGMELWDQFSRRAGPYDRAVLETRGTCSKTGLGSPSAP